MNIFCDTSALIKKYISEIGSDKFEKILSRTDNIFVSAITEIETISTFKRLFTERAIDKHEYEMIVKDFETDFQFFSVVSIDSDIIKQALKMINQYQLKTLDSIQLGTLVYLKNEINSFVACDEKLIKSALKEKIKVINPNQ
jgi:predicted nucleic acid-binding protein